jgi:hypothetical protein
VDICESVRDFGLLVAFFMTLTLDTAITFAMTTITVGWNQEFVPKFLNGWAIAFCVAFPTATIMIPLAREIASKLTK